MRELAKSERTAINISNIANLILFAAKVYASIESKSLAVIASTLDSLLDLLSGFILFFTSYAMKKPNQYSYPIGKKRMQPVVSLLSNTNHPTFCQNENRHSVFLHVLLVEIISFFISFCFFLKKCLRDTKGGRLICTQDSKPEHLLVRWRDISTCMLSLYLGSLDGLFSSYHPVIWPIYCSIIPALHL